MERVKRRRFIVADMLETAMLVLFGLSWPFNIVKSWKSRTTRGRSIYFEALVLAGYFCGVAAKVVAGDFTYVFAFYLLDIAMVVADMILFFRNRCLERAA
jgi:formate hydrogenlyase subunit 3/multisubunit Na+/H+ antiporter MnhD subunit